MKSILFIVPSMRGGGVEKVLLNMIKCMNQKKYSIHILAIMDGGERVNELPSNVTYQYLWKREIRILGRRLRGTDRFFNYVFQNCSSEFLYKFFVKKNYDIIVDYWGQEGLKLAVGAPNMNKKFAFIHIDMNTESLQSAVFPYNDNKELMNAYLKMNAVVCVSRDSQQSMFERFDIPDDEKNKVIVKYNVNLVDEIKEKAKEKIAIVKPDNRIVLCTSGRLTQQKGFIRLLHICATLKKEGNLFCLWILGNGEQQEELERIIIQENLEDTVYLLGYQENPYKYVSKADIFVCSSYYEGFSTVVSEAVILGIPVISTACTGAKEILGESEYGMVTELDDDSLQRGLRQIIKDKKLREYYRAKVVERQHLFDTNERIREIEEIFDMD